MATLSFLQTTIKQRVAHILQDPGIRGGILKSLEMEVFGAGGLDNYASDPDDIRNRIANYDPNATQSIGELESIVLIRGRPVLVVQNDTFTTTSLSADIASKIWQDRLDTAKPFIEPDILAVGRINLRDHPSYDWVGTGWLVADDVVVTNRHVAMAFGFENSNGTYEFQTNFEGRPISATIDFAREYQTFTRREFAVTKILHIEPPNGPDIALLRVEKTGTGGASLARPVPLSDALAPQDAVVAVVGYPARDSRVPDPVLMRNTFSDIYDVKRLAPGTIMRSGAGILEHDASTLGGNSGSIVIDMKTGNAVGLHFAGSFKVANYAVPASIVKSRVAQIAS